MLETPPASTNRLPRNAGITLAVLLTATLATTAYTRDSVQSVSYICGDGDRFSVEYRNGQARVRHGIGVFSLTAQSEGEVSRFSDGNLVLVSRNGVATLKHAGPTSSEDCRPIGLDT